MIYDIPGIFTSVNDRTYIQPVLVGGRSVLIVGFSRFGEEDKFHEISDSTSLKQILGSMDIKKYGMSQFYANGALTKTRSVIFKRLLPDDASYANVVFNDNENIDIASYTGVQDIEAAIFNNVNVSIFGALTARARGEGYNNVHVVFKPAYDTEKFYADSEGDVKYKFNFLTVTIYEETSTGVKTISNEFTVSLLDNDPKTNVPIVDRVTAKELFVNKKFSIQNSYVDFKIEPTKIQSLYTDLNIDDLSARTSTPRCILTDTVTGKNVELIADETGGIQYQSTIQPGLESIALNFVTVDGVGAITTQRKLIKLSSGALTIQPDFAATGVAYDEIYIDGNTSFWKLGLVASGNGDPVINTTTHISERQKLFDRLQGKRFQLTMGSDGENLHPDGSLNMFGPGEASKQNAKQLLMNFFDTDTTIREVIYPELDFDYIPDWSSDIDVQNSIVKLADEIGVSMPIISFGYTNNPDEDYRRRKEDLYFSSYNALLYSGQMNENHYLSETGQIIGCLLSYYAMILHLDIDNTMSITEPVANKNKGALPVSGAKLSYTAKSENIAKLRAVQINTVIKETDGIYLIDQLTAYKNASKLSRANVVKVIHRMRKDIPRLLKDLLQLKAINDITGKSESRVREYMDKWKATADNIVDGIFETIEVKSIFITEEFRLVVSVAVTPIGTVEKIEVPITVL